jgi:hypothetical protein
MTDFLTSIDQHFELFFAFCFSWILACAAFFAWRRHRAGPTHPPLSGSDVRFSEKYASGSSDKNLFTRLGGARNALAITVLKDALLVEPVGIFKWLLPPGFNDLEHFIPRSDILRVESASTLGRSTVRVEIRGADGMTRTLELAARRHEELLSALRS